jgi:undecaprenyl-diphosphatase
MRGGVPDGVRRRLDPGERFGLRLTLLGLAIALAAVPFATLVFQVVGRGSLTRLDGRVADGLNDAVHSSGSLLTAVEVVSFFGRAVWLAVLVAVAALFLWRRRRPRLAAFLVLVAVGGGLLNTAVKVAVDRPRPVVDHPVASASGHSFPSGHSMTSTVCYGALLVTFLPAVRPRRRTLAVAAVALLVLAIGCSRLLLGVHFLSDVLGGFVLGLSWLTASVAAFETWRREEGRRSVEPLSEGVEPESAADLGRERRGRAS